MLRTRSDIAKQKDVAWILNFMIALTAICLMGTLWLAIYKPEYSYFTGITIAIVGPILGVVVSGRIAFLKEMVKEKNEIRKKHLTEIDMSCLRQLESNITRLIELFRFSGSNPLHKPEAFKENARFFEKGLLHFTLFMGIEDWNKILYEDLKSHSITKNIPPMINKFENEVGGKYKLLSENYEKLYNKIEGENNGISKQNLDIILLIALRYDSDEFKNDWKNVWTAYWQAIKNDDKVRDFVYKEGKKYSETKEAKQVAEIQEWIDGEQTNISDKMKIIRRTPNVWDNCNILSKQLDNM
jgi:hypothetical protein